MIMAAGIMAAAMIGIATMTGRGRDRDDNDAVADAPDHGFDPAWPR